MKSSPFCHVERSRDISRRFRSEIVRILRLRFAPLRIQTNMKSSLEAPEKQVSEETTAKPAKSEAVSVIDTSKMSKGKRDALELAEASRDPLDERGSFASNLFIGRYDFNRIFPWPEQTAEDREAGKEFLANLRKISARKCRRRRDRSHRRNSAEKYRRTLRDGRVRSKNPEAIRRPRACRRLIMAGPRCCSEVGTQISPRLFRRINRSACRSRFCCSAPKSRRKNICRALRERRSRRSH